MCDSVLIQKLFLTLLYCSDYQYVIVQLQTYP